MLKIYHNTRCKKSRTGLQLLLDNGLSPEIIEYIKNPLNEKQFRVLLMKLNKTPQEIIRTQEKIYKTEFKGKNFNNDEWIKIILENPKLIKRPIIELEHKAIWGDPVSEIEDVISYINS